MERPASFLRVDLLEKLFDVLWYGFGGKISGTYLRSETLRCKNNWCLLGKRFWQNQGDPLWGIHGFLKLGRVYVDEEHRQTTVNHGDCNWGYNELHPEPLIGPCSDGGGYAGIWWVQVFQNWFQSAVAVMFVSDVQGMASCEGISRFPIICTASAGGQKAARKAICVEVALPRLIQNGEI